MVEERLSGGNSTAVVRVGDTVRRTPGIGAAAVHRLLDTVRAAGVTEVPKPLGFDDRGREILTFLPGDVGGYPLPDWLWNPEIVRDAGVLLRRIHDASVPLVDGDFVWAQPRREPAEVICHNDVAPYNMTFLNGRLTGLFDFDESSPGPRIWDLAYLAYRLAPLVEDAAVDTGLGNRLSRVDRLIEAYGAPFSRVDVLRALGERLGHLAAHAEGRARETANSDFAGHAAMYRRDAARVEEWAVPNGRR